MVPESPAELPDDPDEGVREAHRQPLLLLLVVLGGMAGTGIRELVASALPVRVGAWPTATFAVNLAGCLVLGFLLATLGRRGPDLGRRRQARLLVGTGFCGGLTTYSTFAVEIDLLVRDRAAAVALGYGVVTVLAGVAMAAAGVSFAGRLHRVRGR